jgi:hypothetical protein
MTNEEFIQSIALEGEEWRDVIGYESLYAISSYGRLVSKENVIPNGKGFRKTPPQIKVPSAKKTGYLETILYKNKIPKSVTIHRLVAQAFIPNPEAKPMIDHIDRNRHNNHVSNLRWCSLQENMNNPNTIEHCQRIFTNDSRNKHLSPIVCMNGNTVIQQYSSIKEAIADGFSGPSISNVCAGRQKTHKGYTWMYLSDYETLINKSKNA